VAFALCLDYKGEKHYIHKNYGIGTQSAKTTINMNYAMLFAVESDARRWRQKKQLPMEYEIVFIPIPIKEKPRSVEKRYYTTLRDIKGDESVDDIFNSVFDSSKPNGVEK
jgi:hypothetical protein